MTKAGKRLVLLRHAKSAWPDVPDHERPLAPRGQRDAPVMGGWLRTEGLVPDLVVCSSARRARETWQIAQAGLGAAPPVRYDECVYRASAVQLLAVIRHQPETVTTLLIIGHDPGVPGLAVTLSGAGSASDRTLGRMRAKFPTAAVAVFTCTGSWSALSPVSARLASFICPRDLAGRRL